MRTAGSDTALTGLAIGLAIGPVTGQVRGNSREARVAGPLDGLRVVELAGIGPAPFAAMVLADLGADVVRVDRPQGPGLGFASPEHDVLNRGRPNVAVDLKHPRGPGLVLDLVERADALIESYRPGVTERLGLGPEDCWARNPRLVYGRMTGWGQSGPLARTAGHDVNYIAITGALAAIGRAGGPPQIPLNLMGDFGGGAMFLVAGLLAAIWEAGRSGRGQVVDASVVDGTSSLTALLCGMTAAGAWSGARGENLLDSGAPYYDVYATSDGEYVAVGALEPAFYAELLRGLDLDPAEVPDRADPAQHEALRALFAARFASRSQAEWQAVFDGSDACVSPVLSVGAAPGHPHLRERATYVARDGVVQPAPSPRFSRTEASLTRSPARTGQNSREALAAWGIPDVDALVADRVVLQEGEST
jgi:alpha-methylacyl-CoA racemase